MSLVLNLDLPPETEAWLYRLAAHEKTTVKQLVRHIIEQAEKQEVARPLPIASAPPEQTHEEWLASFLRATAYFRSLNVLLPEPGFDDRPMLQ